MTDCISHAPMGKAPVSSPSLQLDKPLRRLLVQALAQEIRHQRVINPARRLRSLQVNELVAMNQQFEHFAAVRPSGYRAADVGRQRFQYRSVEHEVADILRQPREELPQIGLQRMRSAAT